MSKVKKATRQLDKPCPQLSANSISRLFWFWVFPLLKKGERQELKLDDIYDSPTELASDRVGPIVETEWNKELSRANSSGVPPKLWKTIRNLIWKPFVLTGIGYSVDELVIRALQPLVLKKFIRTFSDNADNDWDHRKSQFIYAGILVLLNLSHNVMYQKMYATIILAGMKIKLGISQLIYQKTLRLGKTDSEHNVGKLCNLLSNDVNRLESVYLHFLYIAPIQLLIYTYLLWRELGVASLGGVVCILLVMPLQWFLGSFYMYFRRHISQRTDQRGRFLNEFIGGVRLIKMYAWEKPFALVVAKLRRDEIKLIGKYLYLKGFYASFQSISMKIIPFSALVPYVALGYPLTADKAFFAISVFNILMHAVVNRLPRSVAQLGEVVVSMQRIEQFLLTPDSKSNLKPKREKIVNNKKSSKNGLNLSGKDDKPCVVMKNYSASWAEDHLTLKNLAVNLKGNKLVIVIGHVGSGKTSFLNAILSELPITSAEKQNGSHLSVHGSLSYASQDAWIFPASIRQNILFGLDMQADKYWRVIKCCGLSEDLEQFPNGDLTIVGERGSALSGGQKARVNLARAVYQDADIHLLDDPLSAVDTRVSKLLFNECFQKHLNGKLRILVTHQLQYLPMADHIIVLNRDGTIWEQGSYEELKNSDIDFTSLISDNYFQKDTEEQKISETEKNGKNPKDGQKETDKLLSSASVVAPKEEEKCAGAVSLGTYHRYFKAGGSYLTIAFLILAFISAQIINNFVDYWLSLWTNSVGDEGEVDGSFDNQNTYAYIYGGLVIGFIVVCVFRSCVFYWYCTQISIKLHNSMFTSLSRAPTKFFDDNPSGRIMNRFTKDLNQIDEKLPEAFYDFMNILLVLFGTVALNVAANSFAILPSALFLLALWRIRNLYLSSSRELARHALSAKSPIFTHVSTTVDGLTFIRAVSGEKRVLREFQRIQDKHTTVHYMMFAITQWFVLYLEMSSTVLLAAVSFGFLILTTPSQEGNVGLAISAILSLSGAIQWGVRQSAETENLMTSVERAFEYTNLKAEAPLTQVEDAEISHKWPNSGCIAFRNVSLAYDHDDKNKVLNNVSFSVNSLEKIGIVGRTGAGKSSLITALFRLTEPCAGSITIDDISIQKVGLHTLRSRISIIPQDPILFTGTLRYNLDPFNEFDSEKLWNVLKEVDLYHSVQSLDSPVADGGSNFSVGQRQLVCLARAILRKNKILILDEATANCDPATDNLVQNAIQTKFSDCTILTIAHRLQTVLDKDKILVMDNGRVVDFDRPEILMKKKTGIFSELLAHSSSSNSGGDDY